jgi:hypothetical protein
MKEAWAEAGEPDRPYFHTYAYCLTPRQFRLIVKDEKLKTIKQLQARSCSMDTLLVHGEWLSQVQDLSAKMV